MIGGRKLLTFDKKHQFIPEIPLGIKKIDGWKTMHAKDNNPHYKKGHPSSLNYSLLCRLTVATVGFQGGVRKILYL